MAVARVDRVDADWGHLWPNFAARLHLTLMEVQAVTHEPWGLVEGYRSRERQHWLYGQGRTRPGRKVTWILDPEWHGLGLAADVMPVHKAYSAPIGWWEALQAAGRRHGLHDPPWRKGDHGHLQLDISKHGEEYEAAARWAAAGFPPVSGGGQPIMGVDPPVVGVPGVVVPAKAVRCAGEQIPVESIGWQGHQYVRTSELLAWLGQSPATWDPATGELSLPAGLAGSRGGPQGSSG